jgi:hypothetical protein
MWGKIAAGVAGGICLYGTGCLVRNRLEHQGTKVLRKVSARVDIKVISNTDYILFNIIKMEVSAPTQALREDPFYNPHGPDIFLRHTQSYHDKQTTDMWWLTTKRFVLTFEEPAYTRVTASSLD